MRIAVIGGSGHVGTYLVPTLVQSGHEVHNLTRGRHAGYGRDPAWRSVTSHVVDRAAEDAAGTFGRRVAELKPDVVIDMICFDADSARQLVEAIRGRVQMLLHCGTIWVHGHCTSVPVTEDAPRKPYGDYGIKKEEVEAYLLDEARRTGFPATVLHPGHIVGPGWSPLNPAGHFDPRVFGQLARGEPLALPHLGMETLHHVHAADVAQAFTRAMASWSTSVGESFHVVSPAALTLRGYAMAVAGWFGREATLEFQPWTQWAAGVSADEAAATLEHISHSPNASIEKARRLLGYEPRYTSLEAIRESVDDLVRRRAIDIE